MTVGLASLIQHILWDFVQNHEASRSISDGPEGAASRLALVRDRVD
jgi:hypothetical protein